MAERLVRENACHAWVDHRIVDTGFHRFGTKQRDGNFGDVCEAPLVHLEAFQPAGASTAKPVVASRVPIRNKYGDIQRRTMHHFRYEAGAIHEHLCLDRVSVTCHRLDNPAVDLACPLPKILEARKLFCERKTVR